MKIDNTGGGTEVTKFARSIGLDPFKDMIDATEPVVVRVRASDIAIAKKHNKQHCVIARAAVRTLDNVAQAWVWPTIAWLHTVDDDGNSKILRYVTGSRIKDAINVFDKSHKFPTGEYALLVPTGTQRISYIRSEKAIALKKNAPSGRCKRKRNSDGSLKPKVRTRAHYGTATDGSNTA